MMLAWQDFTTALDLPDQWIPWLGHFGSMTRALEEATQSKCEVLVLHEGWSSTGMTDWVREVMLYFHHKPLIFAQSVFPSQLIERHPGLTTLESQPLGNILFAHNAFQRASIDVAKIDKRDDFWVSIPVEFREEVHWARRSLFYSYDTSFYLIEVFSSHVATLS